jgi:phospholipid/cholesterol/gamma-HCH transport system substrate-binding protein
MNRRWMRIEIGVFVALALVLLGTLIVLFNSLPRLFRVTTVYTARFTDDVSGLSPGAPVRRSGVPVGTVADMTLDDVTGAVNVRLALDQPYVIRHNEQVTLTTSLLGNEAVIDLVTVPPPEGQAPDTTPVPPGTVLVGVRAGNFNQLVARASEVVPTTQDTLNDIRKSMQRIEKMAPLVEDTFREYRDLGHKLNDAMPDLRQTNADLDKLAQSSDKVAHQLQDAIPQVTRDADDVAASARALQKVSERVDVILAQNQDQINESVRRLNEVLTRTASLLNEDNIRNVNDILRNTRAASESFPELAHNSDELLKEGRNSLQRFNATLTRLDDLTQNLQKMTKPLADRSDVLARNLDEGLARLNRTTADLDALLLAIGQSDGTLNKLLTDPSLYNHLDEVACQAAKAAPQLNLILKDFETFADKLARHPESIGLGGLVRPSSGLKDPPTPPGLVIPPTHP